MNERVPRETNPLLGSKNKLKLGVFGVNVSSGCTMTDLPNTIKAVR